MSPLLIAGIAVAYLLLLGFTVCLGMAAARGDELEAERRRR